MISTTELMLILRTVFKTKRDGSQKLASRGPVPRFYIKTFNNMQKIYPEYDFKNFYVLNSSGQRCDEFKTIHSGKHILFAGCSETFGVGNLLENVWAHKLYKRISKDEATSGYFNIGLPGGTISEIIQQIHNYFNEFGYPDVLFINFPDHHRELSRILNNIHGNKKISFKEDIDQNYVAMTIVNSYELLMDICRLNGVKVYPFSWELDYLRAGYELMDPRQRMSNLLEIKENELIEHCERFVSEKQDSELKKFFITALDDDHSGIAVHDFWYNKIYSYYKKDRE